MRLLHTEDLHFEEFFDSRIPDYLILSHRWGEKEVSFREMSKGKAPEGPGLTKIKNFCSMASHKDFKWVWIDTCCIDKRSSAELSEAINSMFRWYERAQECWVYLSDVSVKQPRDGFGPSSASKREIIKSKWFTRGWTLQELLAPTRLWFLESDWSFIGQKDELLDEIVKATNIREICLTSALFQIEACVAEKMSWLSDRETSRIEDMSYCMLGLFDINMPLLYGEGEKAFHRLQLEILRKSPDESIFVFDKVKESAFRLGDLAVLARSPIHFHKSGDVRQPYPGMHIRYSSLEPCTVAFKERPPYSITNKGLKFRIPPDISNAILDQNFVRVPLGCYRLKGGVKEGCSLTLQRWNDVWCRLFFVQELADKNPDHGGQSPSEDTKWPAIYLNIDPSLLPELLKLRAHASIPPTNPSSRQL